jgi:hypothetical protein
MMMIKMMMIKMMMMIMVMMVMMVMMVLVSDLRDEVREGNNVGDVGAKELERREGKRRSEKMKEDMHGKEEKEENE